MEVWGRAGTGEGQGVRWCLTKTLLQTFKKIGGNKINFAAVIRGAGIGGHQDPVPRTTTGEGN